MTPAAPSILAALIHPYGPAAADAEPSAAIALAAEILPVIATLLPLCAAALAVILSAMMVVSGRIDRRIVAAGIAGCFTVAGASAVAAVVQVAAAYP